MTKLFFILVSLLLLFSGCSRKAAIDYNKNAHLKAFEDEDKYIMLAIDSHQKGAFFEAYKIYEYLYEKSDKTQYLHETLNSLLALQDYQELAGKIKHYMKKRPKDINLRRLLVVAYIKQDRLELALQTAIATLEISKSRNDYEQVAALYINQKDYALAVKYLESAYAISYDEETLDRLATILFVYLDRKKDSIAYLETHTRLHGCSRLICTKLAAFYGELNDADGMLSVYKRLYERYNEAKFAKSIAKIYAYQKRYDKLIAFLESSHIDDDYLLKLYISQKSYKKVLKLSYQLYKETNDVEYLGQYAIYSYESSSDKNNKKMLKSVIKNLEKVIAKKSDESLYLNYLGYIFIDHNINLKKGMKLVKKALLLDPTSGYYLDSLAWGHYKLKECKKAKDVMNRVVKILGSDDKEVKVHLKAIKKCKKR